MLAGNAAPCVHNGVVRCDNKGSVLKHPLNGIRSRSEIGFLFFNKQENENKRTHVSIIKQYETDGAKVFVENLKKRRK